MIRHYPKEWESVSLNDIFNRVRRKNTGNCENALTISAKHGLVNQKDYFNRYVASKNLEGYYLIKNGEFAYNKSYSAGYPMGVIKRLDDYQEGVLSTLYICFAQKDNSEMDSDYLTAFFDSGLFNSEIRSIAQEGGRAHGLLNVSVGEFFDLRLEKPSLKEQRKISEIVSKITAYIELTEDKISKYKFLKRSLWQKFTQNGLEQSKLIDSPLGKIPEGWKVMKVGEACNIQNNFRKPINRDDRKEMKGIYPYFGPTGVLDYINEHRLDGKFALIGEDGDYFLKFNRSEQTLFVNGKFNVNNHAHVIGESELCTPEWFHTYFLHKDITKFLSWQGASRYKLSKGTLESLLIPIPPKDEQLGIYKKLESISFLLGSLEKKLSKFQNIKKGVTLDLLTGKVRV